MLGTTNAEHERLIRQGQLLAPFTERLFRSAGIVEGQRILDIGCGVGEVAILAARLVGPAGRVVGVDIDAAALAKARARALEAGLTNVEFVNCAIERYRSQAPFDAAVGRFILQFLPDPIAVLRILVGLVRPGGILAFHEPNWKSLLSETAHLPLRFACARLIFETFQRAGVRTDMETILYQGFQEARLPKPALSLETPLGHDFATRRWLYDLMCAVRPKIDQYDLPLEGIGDYATLEQRLAIELAGFNSFAACIGLVGAWSRKPVSWS
jgi:ubiquinone/menaquinone biosynthesis C-methylase UbiE